MKRLWLLFAQVVTVGLAIGMVLIWCNLDGLGPTSLFRHIRLRKSDIQLHEAVPTQKATPSYRDVARRAMPPVVNIFTTKEARDNNPFTKDEQLRQYLGDQDNNEEKTQSGIGSGVIISPEGYVVTNFHIVNGATEIDVALTDGRKTRATVIGSDPDTDLAVLKIDLKQLPVMTLAPPDQAEVGDIVLAVGNPFGVGQTVTMGIVSALGRSHLGINTFENFIQSDAAINPGNSGGALIDLNGNLIGINTAIYSRSGGSLGISFSIPVSTVKSVMDSIIATGQVTRGFIGVEPQEITPELASSFNLARDSGVIMAGIVKDGSADKAGIRPGDILTDIDGVPVHDSADMMNKIAKLEPGSTVKLDMLRKNQKRSVTVSVTRRPRPSNLPDPDNKDKTD